MKPTETLEPELFDQQQQLIEKLTKAGFEQLELIQSLRKRIEDLEAYVVRIEATTSETSETIRSILDCQKVLIDRLKESEDGGDWWKHPSDHETDF